LINDFGRKWVPDAVCYHLDGKAGHVVGTVMRKIRGLGKRNGNETNYGVVWEFSTLGETNVPYSYLLEGNKETDRLMMQRKKMIGGRKKRKTMNERQWLKDNLCMPSDDEKEMKAPDSDESISSASCGSIYDEQNDDNWFLYVPDDEANANSVINGLHWEFDGVINEEPSEKQPP